MTRVVLSILLLSALSTGCQETSSLAASRSEQTIIVVPTDSIRSGDPVGTIEGRWSVSQGSASYAVGLVVPSGRREMQPTVALRYVDNGANGPLGIGWGMVVGSAVAPCGRNFADDGAPDAPRFDGTDRYCLDGRRLNSTGGGEFVTFPDTNQRIQAEGTATGASAQVPARFVVDDGYGVRSVYETRVLAPRPRYVDANGQIPVTDETVVYRWLLTYREDHYGNRIEYRYHEEEASTVHIELEPDLRFAVEYWLERIEYTSNPSAGLAARRAIRFEYERRPDPVDSFVSGVHRRHSHLLKRIVMEAPNPSAVEDVWSYVLNYERQEQNGVSAGRSRLSSLTRCDQFGGCQAPTRFEWAAPEPVFGAPEPQNINRWNDVEQQPELQTADFNGDGFDDLLFWRGDVDACEWSSGIGDWTWGGRETSDGIGNCDPDRDGSRVIGRWLIAYS
ncbi:MAG: SpvB/TcaC N-terminal domain-containing protein, partial [Myxococcota bacterium]